jgi:hypothetical protein
LHQRGRQKEPGVGHQVLLVEAGVDGVQSVGCCRLSGASCYDVGCVAKTIVAVGLKHLSLCQDPR